MECGNIVTIFFKCSNAEKPNHGHHWLLRARRNRPSSCTAKKGDELAPSHVPSVRLRTGHRIASKEQTGRVGSEDSRCPLWVKSRHVRRTRPCPLYPR